MSGFEFKITGLSELKDRIEKISSGLQPDIVNEMKGSAANIATSARLMAPTNFGTLKNSITWDPVDEDSVEVGAAAEYAPYVEFGTGTMVDIPEGMEEYAMTFKGEGKKQVNLPPRPFLFPAFAIEKPLLIGRIVKLVDSK